MVSTNEITINLLDVVNNMQVTKEQKEEVLLQIMGVQKEDGQFIYEGGNITCFQFYGSVQQMEVTVEIDQENVQ